MNKQDKRIYSSLMNRIAIVMLLNQGFMVILGWLLMIIAPVMKSFFGESQSFDTAYWLCECFVYLLSFALPMNIFIKMNKDADKEIYEPVDSEKMPTYAAVCAVFFSLGAIIVASYVNYLAVNSVFDYSDFTAENLWSVELVSPYQMVIYFIYSAIVPAIAEEFLFRGAICRSLTVYGKSTAIIVSAVLFALMHTNAEQVLYSFCAGLLLGWIYVETKSIAFPILVHFLNNGIPTVGEIVGMIYGQEACDLYFVISDAILIVLSLVSTVGLIKYVKKKGRLIDKLVIKPDENGEPVASLTVKERVSGFFSRGIMVFIVYSLIVMMGLVLLAWFFNE